jgi:hypothetical protein
VTLAHRTSSTWQVDAEERQKSPLQCSAGRQILSEPIQRGGANESPGEKRVLLVQMSGSFDGVQLGTIGSLRSSLHTIQYQSPDTSATVLEPPSWLFRHGKRRWLLRPTKSSRGRTLSNSFCYIGEPTNHRQGMLFEHCFLIFPFCCNKCGR